MLGITTGTPATVGADDDGTAGTVMSMSTSNVGSGSGGGHELTSELAGRVGSGTAGQSALGQAALGQAARSVIVEGQEAQSMESTDWISATASVGAASLLGTTLVDVEVIGTGLLGAALLGAGCGVAGFGSGVAGAASVVSAGAPSSHDQYHDQFQSQSRLLPSPATVVISDVWPHQVNVQTQSQDGSLETGPVAGALGAVFVCVTGPLSPGLSTRIETLTFAGPACGPPDPRP
jgi:hypothetical protein